MAKTREKSGDAAGSGAVLAAVTFRALANNSRVLALQHRLEVSYGRQYKQALATLPKPSEIPDSSPSSGPPIQLATEPGTTIFKSKPILRAKLEMDLTRNARG
jgi:hypothetical protein